MNRQIVGFKKIKFYTMENVGAGNLSMPEQEMHTTAFWLTFPESFLARFPDLSPTEKQNGLTGLGNVLRTAAAFLLMCDPRDLGVAFGENIAERPRQPTSRTCTSTIPIRAASARARRSSRWRATLIAHAAGAARAPAPANRAARAASARWAKSASAARKRRRGFWRSWALRDSPQSLLT